MDENQRFTIRILVPPFLLGWAVLIPFAIFGMLSLANRTLALRAGAAFCACVILVNWPATLTIDSDGVRIAWLGRHFVARWGEIARIRRTSWSSQLELKNGKSIPIMKVINTPRALGSAHDLLVERFSASGRGG